MKFIVSLLVLQGLTKFYIGPFNKIYCLLYLLYLI